MRSIAMILNLTFETGALSNGTSFVTSGYTLGAAGLGWGSAMGSMFKALGNGLEVVGTFAGTDYGNYGGQ